MTFINLWLGAYHCIKSWSALGPRMICNILWSALGSCMYLPIDLTLLPCLDTMLLVVRGAMYVEVFNRGVILPPCNIRKRNSRNGLPFTYYDGIYLNPVNLNSITEAMFILIYNMSCSEFPVARS
uniref:Uncharacterized protein n=2 Tax=Aegilops tauschii subsp. strangulata TaxID=200361 RepID=A0A453R2Q4_AEGTS